MYYAGPDGKPSGELDNYRQMLRILRQLYGDLPVAALRSVELLALGNWTMQHRDWCRKHLNDQIWRVKAVFGWAVMTGPAAASVADGLAYVRSIRKGKSPLRDNPRVQPVSPAVIAKVKPHLSRHLAAVLELQLRTGARSSELLGLRVGQVIRKRRKDGTRRWWAVLDHHKTAHHGKSRRLYFLRRARAVLRPFLVGRPAEAYIFDPRDAERERREQVHAARKTPTSCGNSPGTNRTASPLVAPGERYTAAAYRRAIQRACDAAFPPPESLARHAAGVLERFEGSP